MHDLAARGARAGAVRREALLDVREQGGPVSSWVGALVEAAVGAVGGGEARWCLFLLLFLLGREVGCVFSLLSRLGGLVGGGVGGSLGDGWVSGFDSVR